MVTRVEKEGIEECMGRVNLAINDLTQAADDIQKAMDALPEYWEGASYNKAREVYEGKYQGFLMNTVPNAVAEFRDYINACMAEILEIDSRLAGN